MISSDLLRMDIGEVRHDQHAVLAQTGPIRSADTGVAKPNGVRGTTSLVRDSKDEGEDS